MSMSIAFAPGLIVFKAVFYNLPDGSIRLEQ